MGKANCMRMRKILLFLFVWIFIQQTNAQINRDGIPFIRQYTDKEYGDLGQVWAIEKGADGMMYFGCNYGLKVYDGVSWKTYGNANSTIIRSLKSDPNGNIYYGAEGDFGIIRTNEKGELYFYSLYLNFYKSKDPDFGYKSKDPDFGSVWKTLIADDQLFFQAAEKIFYTDLPIKFDKNDSLLNKIKEIHPQRAPFHNSFSVNGNFYVREWETGLCRFDGDSLIELPGGADFGLKRIYIMQAINENEILTGTRNYGFYKLNTATNTIEPFTLKNDKLLTESIIYAAAKINDDSWAIGTFKNGILVIDKKGKVHQIFNKQTTQTGNRVLSVYYDETGKVLWFANNNINKANIQNPFTRWTEQSGISGIPSSVARFNNHLYLTTDNGLYRLLEDTDSISKFQKQASVTEAKSLMQFSPNTMSEPHLLFTGKNGIYQITPDNKLLKIYETQAAGLLFQSTRNNNTIYFGNTSGFYQFQYEPGIKQKPQKHPEINQTVISIYEDSQHLLLGTFNSGVLALKQFDDKKVQLIDSTNGLTLDGMDFILHNINHKPIVSCGKGLFEIKFQNDSAFAIPFKYFGDIYSDSTKGVYQISETEKSFLLSVYNNKGEQVNHQVIHFLKGEKLSQDTGFAAILPRKAALFFFNDGKYTWIGNEKGLFTYNSEQATKTTLSIPIRIREVFISNDSLLYGGYNFSPHKNSNNKYILPFSLNDIFFEFAAPFFHQEEKTNYSYRLKGLNNQWSKWTSETKINFTNLPEGDYTFEVKARNIYQTESTTAQFSFTILPPWYRTIWAYMAYIIIAGLLIWLIVKLYTRKLRRENEILEQKVQERTIEIREKNAQLQQSNEEILAQRDEIETQRDELEVQRDKIAEQQQSIMDSIRYAGRIQSAIMPPKNYLNKILGDHFVLFKPRDVVSGDFYWAAQFDEKTIIVAADCTGHGVPGAFMSMLGISFLNEIVIKEKTLQANIILNRLRQNVKTALRQESKDSGSKDGMDIALLVIERKTKTVQYAGAYNPLYIIRNNEIITHKADRMPIGIYLREKDSFTNNEIQLETNDLLYIFSDGFVDQFGGEKGKKLKSGNFKKLLLEIADKPMEAQKELLDGFFAKWISFNPKTGNPYEQVDDIVIAGLKID